MTERRDLSKRAPRPAPITGDPADPAADPYGTEPMRVPGMPTPRAPQPSPEPEPTERRVPGVRVLGEPTYARQFRFTRADNDLFDAIMAERRERPTDAMRWFLRTYGPVALDQLRREGR